MEQRHHSNGLVQNVNTNFFVAGTVDYTKKWWCGLAKKAGQTYGCPVHCTVMPLYCSLCLAIAFCSL